MKTRKTKNNTSSSQQDNTTDIPSTTSIPEQDPVRLLLLPSNASPQARICTLSHPATSKQCRYYFCPENGVYEFQRVAVPRRDCRSWLLGRRLAVAGARGRSADGSTLAQGNDVQDVSQEEQFNSSPRDDVANGEESARSISQGHAIKDPDLFIATPIDPVFLILPSFYAQLQKSTKGLFLSLDDLLESACETSRHLKHIIESAAMQQRIETAMAAVCDTVSAGGDEKMYRLNIDKLVAELLAKTKRMVSSGLPASMEAKFIAKPLETPVMSLKREESSISQSGIVSLASTDSQSTSTAESQPSTTTTESTSSAQTDITIPSPSAPPTSAPTQIHDLLRLRTALNYLLKAYLPPSLANSIRATLSSTTDFTPLDIHLSHLSTLRAEAQASRSLSDFSRKRNMMEDEEAAEAKAEKKRKKEDEEKAQRARETRGMRDLKKVDVRGMKKMSEFFGKGKEKG
ncbi:MAG: hypothetical protein LQ338_007849 [Usnochroma carphineum]|nr:MAG: hypothetical protein LQ338_007849 [Usnochroma carphineum]